jgi:hypothetical protein
MIKLLDHYCDPMGRITDEAYARIGGTIEPPGAAGLMPVEEIGDSSVGWRDEAFLPEKAANA